MRKTLILILALMLCGIALVMGDITNYSRQVGRETSIGTNQSNYVVLRTVTSNDSALTTTTQNWEDVRQLMFPVPPEYSSILLQFYGYGDGTGVGSPANGTFDFKVYMAKKYGSAILVASANDAVVGASQLSHNPGTGVALTTDLANDPNSCWVDTCTVTDTWTTTVSVGGGGGSDGCAVIAFDPLGYSGIYVEITDITSLSAVTVVMTGCGG
jgi:hypothetical protein